FAGRSAFSTWLSRIAIHEAWARLRRGKRFEALEDHPSGEGRELNVTASDTDPEGDAFGREVRSLVEAAVDALPESYRTVFVLRQIEELSTAETAECLELSEEAVKVRLHRARTALKQDLLSRAGAGIKHAFPFLGHRCDRMVERVLARVRALTPPAAASPGPGRR